MLKNIQYFKPGTDLNSGDPMPFFHDGRFHLYYLIDKDHHRSKNWLGGHYWAHMSTTDLREWEEHPVALPLGQDGEYDQNSICTGCVYYWDGIFHAPYATRIVNDSDGFSEQLCWATSEDGIHFTKDAKNPLMKAPVEFRERDFRDFFIFRDEQAGLFHMLATTYRTSDIPFKRTGCLLQYTSKDLIDWRISEPILEPGTYGPPECPDYFQWGGKYYLTFLSEMRAVVRMSENPYGPWVKPSVDSFDGWTTLAQKSAMFGDKRRIAVSFLPCLENNKDGGTVMYGGNTVFRELVQNEDGSLGCKFPPEMIPAHGSAILPAVQTVCGDVDTTGEQYRFNNLYNLGVVRHVETPINMRVTMKITQSSSSGSFGVCLRCSDNLDRGYELRITPDERTVLLYNIAKGKKCGNRLDCVDFGELPIKLDIICKNDIIDVCINERRCIINRFPESLPGDMFLFCENSEAIFDHVKIYPLLEE